jgi:hypothetical protein
MPKYILDLSLDGYDSEEEEKEACDIFIKEQLDFSASSVLVKPLEETKDGPTIGQLSNLWNVCRKFVNEYKPSCPESIYQVDRISLACEDFVTEICDCVGYYDGDKEGDK